MDQSSDERRPPPVRLSRGFAPLVTLVLLGAAAAGLLAGLAASQLAAWPLGIAALLLAGGLGWAIWSWRRSVALAPTNTWRDLIPCYLSVQDRQLRIIKTNALFRRDFGDMAGAYCYRAYKNRQSPCPGCPVLQTFADGQEHSGQEEVLTREGQRAQVMVTSTPYLLREDGTPSAVIEMSTNISEIKELQEQLEQSRAYFQRLFEIVPCYITVQDHELRIIESNALFRQDFGEAAGASCFRLYKKRETPCLGCPVLQTFADGEVHSSEETVIGRDGQEANVIVYSMPVKDERGQVSSVMEVSTNITEVKRLQHQLAMMGLAVAGMAHRIKNILMGLEGGIFVVNTGFEDSDKAAVQEGWQMVERNVDKISRLVKDLLYCSKEREPSFQEDLDPAPLLRETYELYRSRAESSGITLQLELAESLPRARLDPEGIANLVGNLVANAIDACRFDPDSAKQHRIHLACRRAEGGHLLLEVSDSGPGIPAEMTDKVFKGFFSTKGTEGTGLGLLVVQKVAEEHGGRVSFSSREGAGTTFRVILPALHP